MASVKLNNSKVVADDNGFKIANAFIASPADHISFDHNTNDAFKTVGAGSYATNHETPVILADDESFTLPDASTGFGLFMAGNMDEYAKIAWASDGSVTIVRGSDNVANSDSDGNLCFVDGGTQVSVKNRLGAPREVWFEYRYTT